MEVRGREDTVLAEWMEKPWRPWCDVVPCGAWSERGGQGTADTACVSSPTGPSHLFPITSTVQREA